MEHISFPIHQKLGENRPENMRGIALEHSLEEESMKRFEVPENYPRLLREAEASSRLEGIDTRGDVLGNRLKAQILAGEISVAEAIKIYTEDIRRSVGGGAS